MKDLWFRVLVAWYRLTGSSQVQAEWKARRAKQKPDEIKVAVVDAAARTGDRRYNCVCGQLLVAEDKVCHACGRRQYLPFAVRRAFRAVGLVVPSALPGTILAAVSMVIGYAIQLRYGTGGLFDPSPGAETYELGSAFPGLVLGSQPWRAFTYTMLHGNLMHIGFNAFALMQVGPLVEHAFGSSRFAFSWVVGGILAAAIPALLGSSAPMVGASGSVFALIGMALVWGHLVGTAHGRMVRDVMVKWVIYATVFGLLIGNVAHGAHFAGLGVGAALGYLLPPPGANPTRRRISPALVAVSLGLVVASLAGAGSWFAEGRPVPLDLPPRMQLALAYDKVDRQGWEAVVGEEAFALFTEARAVAEAGRPLDRVSALKGKVNAAKAKMEPPVAYLFDQEIHQRLYPKGRGVDPHDPQR